MGLLQDISFRLGYFLGLMVVGSSVLNALCPNRLLY